MASILSDPSTTACTFILLLEVIIGMSSTIFIVGTIVNESKQRKSMKTGNKIRIALNISNVCYTITVFGGAAGGFLRLENDQIPDSTSAYVVYSMSLFTMNSSSWITAALSFFYFIKIQGFKAKVIVWAKKNINMVLPWLIMGVEVLALCSSFFGMLFVVKPQSSSMNNSRLSLNSSISNYDTGFLTIDLAVSCAPSLIIVVTSGFTARVLIKHRNNMMESMGTSTKNKAKSYENLVHKLMRIIVNYMVYYLFVFLFYVTTLFHLKVELLSFLVIISSFTTVLFILRIIMNPKLKTTAMEILNCTICTKK